MRSTTAITYELDDIPVAVAELATQIKEKVALDSDSVGILYGQPDMDLAELSYSLNQELGFDIIGGTTAGAAMLLNDGYHELAVILHVLTAWDCHFVTAISESLETDFDKHIVQTYNDTLTKLRECDKEAKPGLVFCVTPIVQNYPSDESFCSLNKVANGLPTFGFVAADDFEFSKQQVFLNGVTGGDRIALLLISGNIKPIFEVRNLAGTRTLSKRHVTKSHNNVICEIDGKPAYDYISEFPFINQDAGVLWNYQFFIEMPNESNDDGASVSRVLNNFDKKTGEIRCFANVPENSYIALLYCDIRDVKATCKNALNSILSKIESQDEYKYSTILIASCSIRNMFLANDKAAEGDLIKEIMPSNIAASGIYAFGEIAPTSVKNEKAVNRFHNSTMTICAI